MGGFDHGRAEAMPKDEQATARNARYGIVLFALYLTLYAVFVLLNTFRPQVMDLTPLAGINLAVLYGFGLIIAAFVLALIYAWLCRGQAGSEQSEEGP
jgi:uncharacterized membrane protein (DUF485 family)